MKHKNTIYFAAICIIIVFGFILRLKAYLSFRSVWLDEAFLFFNIYEKNFSGLFSNLDWWQSAPPIFLVIEKIFVSLFGIKEFSLRLFPLLCSFVSLPVFYLFSKNILSKKISIIIANILFAVNMYLIFYSQELKQYSLDVLSFMLLFLFLKDLSIKDFNIKKSIKYILITAIFPFVSLISYFPIAGWFIREIIINKTQCFKRLFILHIPLIILSVYYYIAMLRPQRLQILSTSAKYWEQGYLSFDIQNNFNIIKNMLLYIFKPCDHIILLIILVIIGIGLLIKKYKRTEVLLLLIILTEILFASLLQVYPIFRRSSLFLIPAVIIIVSYCLEIFDITSLNKKIYSFVIIILFLISFCNYDYKYITQRLKGEVQSYSNPKLMMQVLKEKYKPDEIVIISNPSKAEYLYYKLYFNFKPEKEIYTSEPFSAKEEFEKELNEIIQPSKKYWFFYSIDYTDGKIVNNTLKEWKNNYKVLYENKKLKKHNNSYILHLQT